VYLAGPRRDAPRRAAPNNTLLVAHAEQDLSEGKPAKAAANALAAFPALKIVKPGTLPLADRALRILALATVRADGAVDARDRTAALDWSVRVLRELAARRDNNPSYQTDLGEALAKLPSGHAEAAKILGELADKDLLTSAEGYAALARLRAESGDKASRDALVKRCETMTKTPAAVCAVPAVADTGSQT
jgi:hypothetical protein